MRKLTAAAIAVVLCTATAAHADWQENNSWLNNSWLNNSWLNNSWLNNSWLNNSWLNAGNADGYTVRQMTTWQGQPIYNAALAEGAFTGSAWVWEWGYRFTGFGFTWGWGWTYRALQPWEFNGAQMDVVVTDGATNFTSATIAARISSVVKYGNFMNSYYYLVEANVPDQNGAFAWRPACGCELGTGENGVACVPVKSVALQGSWNYTQGTLYGGSKTNNSADRVTFGCMTSALGKCGAEKALTNGMGYVPWRWRYEWAADGVNQTFTMGSADHAICTRMVTADYCGDGRPHTYTGNFIEQGDLLPPPPNQVNQVNSSVGSPEAGWDTNGAIWIDCLRVAYMPPNPGAADPMQCPSYMTCNYFGCTTVRHSYINVCGGRVTPKNKMVTRNRMSEWNPALALPLRAINYY